MSSASTASVVALRKAARDEFHHEVSVRVAASPERFDSAKVCGGIYILELGLLDVSSVLWSVV